jgi:hypothetical protein
MRLGFYYARMILAMDVLTTCGAYGIEIRRLKRPPLLIVHARGADSSQRDNARGALRMSYFAGGAEYLWGAFNDGSLIEASLVTFRRLLIGYAIGVAIALPVGVFISTSESMQDAIGALALSLQTLPSVC